MDFGDVSMNNTASAKDSTPDKEQEEEDAVCRGSTDEAEQTSTNQREIGVKEEDDEEFSTSLSVADGRYLVDLGSSSEFIVDEKCILELLKKCRSCNRHCRVRKNVKGLKLVVHQTCYFCQNRFEWSNLPDDDLQTNEQQSSSEAI